MARQREKPVEIPQGVEVKVENGNKVTVKGPLGQLTKVFNPKVSVVVENGKVWVKKNGSGKFYEALQGTVRSLVRNMIEGVTKGFQKDLVIVGIGYRAQKSGRKLILNVGYSHPVEIEPPEGIEIEVPGPQEIIVKGIDKELVGNVAARIRDVRPPEPYKGKGIRYKGEVVRRKMGKRAV